MKNIVVLVSGGGTNLQALIDAEKTEGLGEGKITCVRPYHGFPSGVRSLI